MVGIANLLAGVDVDENGHEIIQQRATGWLQLRRWMEGQELEPLRHGHDTPRDSISSLVNSFLGLWAGREHWSRASTTIQGTSFRANLVPRASAVEQFCRLAVILAEVPMD